MDLSGFELSDYDCVSWQVSGSEGLDNVVVCTTVGLDIYSPRFNFSSLAWLVRTVSAQSRHSGSGAGRSVPNTFLAKQYRAATKNTASSKTELN